MQQALTGYLRKCGVNGFIVTAKRFAVMLMLACVVPLTACAYTVVMRSGRRVEIPATFNMTRNTLTYEYAPGIYITLQLVSIDIAATERANNEPAGSFLKRLEQQAAVKEFNGKSATATARPRLTITDKDLEAARRARLESEKAYERRRVELGLPSLEETRRQREEEAAMAREQLRLSVEEEAQSEAYWRERSSQLRAEIAATDAEIGYLRARLSEIPDPFSSGSYTVVTSVGSSLPVGHGVFPHRRPTHPGRTLGHPRIITPYRSGAPITGRVGFGGGSTRGQILINPPTVTNFGLGQAATAFGFRRQQIAPFFPTPLNFVGASPFYQYPSYEREALAARLYDLEAHSAGLRARWRVLEDESRRAGALPGWLRP